jgi:hypothetical protein
MSTRIPPRTPQRAPGLPAARLRPVVPVLDVTAARQRACPDRAATQRTSLAAAPFSERRRRPADEFKSYGKATWGR